MPMIDADGTPINVLVEGPAKAPALVFSNSLGSSLQMWDDQAKVFAKRFRVVRYDQRGHGKSGVPEGAYSIERHALDALAIMNQLGIMRAHFCGLSMGGMTGMWLARHMPERIGRLVLSNTTPKSQTPESWNSRIRTVLAKGVAGVADAVLGFWFTKEFRERSPQTISRMREMMVATDKQGYVRSCAGIRDMDQRWGIADIKVPTLIIAGRHDPGATVQQAEFMAARIPGSELVVLEAAHISNVEQPAAYTDTVEKFLKKD